MAGFSLSSFLKAAPRGMLISVLIAFVFLNGLGVWQLRRMQWKEALIHDMAQTEAQAPVPIQSLMFPNSSEEFGKGDCPSEPLREACAAPERTKNAWRSVIMPACTVNPSTLIYMHSELSGAPGYRLLAACPLPAGAQDMLVDLGFSANKLNLKAPINIDSGVGCLRPYEKASAFTPVNRPADHDWYWRSAGEDGAALGASLRSDYFLVLDLDASHLHIDGLQQGPLNPAVTVPPERHFEYALTWFGLGWALIGVFISFVFQRLRKPE